MKVWIGVLAACGLLAAQYRPPVDRAPESARSLRNPMAEQDGAVRAGAKLYQQECAACHGPRREGGGKIPPLDQPRIREAEPGALFWVLKNGSVSRGMPSFAHLPEAQRWQIISFLSTRGRW